MKLTVTGRYVDLDFGTATPVKLSQKFANESVALSAAIMIASVVEVGEFTFYSEKHQKTIVGFEALKEVGVEAKTRPLLKSGRLGVKKSDKKVRKMRTGKKVYTYGKTAKATS